MKSTMRPYPLLLVALVAFGCADNTTAPTPLSVLQSPQLTLTSGPAELPNVMRFREEFVFAIPDERRGLLAVAGLPDNLLQSDICGGPVETHFGVVEHQWVGLQQGIIKARAKGEANLDVYDLATFTDLCVDAPIAHGKGTIAAHANDLFMTSGRAFLFGFSMQGLVTLATGGTAHLSADALEQVSASGEFRQTVGNVILRGQ